MRLRFVAGVVSGEEISIYPRIRRELMESVSNVCSPLALSMASLAAVASTAMAGGPPTFTNETATRLSAAASVGSADNTEKDYGIGDFDQDGDMDVFVARRTRLNPPNGLGNLVAAPNVLLMNEGGVLTDRTAALAPDASVSHASRDVLVMDLNNDGLLDLFVVNGSVAPQQIFLNQGFNAMMEWQGFDEVSAGVNPLGNMDGWTVTGGDLQNDGDDYPDVYIGVRSGTHKYLRNRGESGGAWLGFADISTTLLGPNQNTSGAIKSSQAIDINDDGDVDLVYDEAFPTGQLRILHNNGAGSFTGTPQTVFSGQSYNFGLGDLDGNGVIDFYGVRNGVDQIRTNLGAGPGDTVSLGATLSAPGISNGFGAICRPADLDGDGTTDFLVADLDQEFPADCSRRLRIFFNSGMSPFLTDGYPVAQAWNHNGTSDIALIDLDADGDLDMMVGHCSGNTIWMQDGSPTVPGDLNGDGLVNGADLANLLSQWGGAGSADLNGDGIVNGSDLATLLANWTG